MFLCMWKQLLFCFILKHCAAEPEQTGSPTSSYLAPYAHLSGMRTAFSWDASSVKVFWVLIQVQPQSCC